jgi:hypothetical protein
MNDDLMRAIGRLESKVDGLTEGQARQEARLEGMDKRLRAVEVSSAKSGAVAGGIAGVMVALGVDLIRTKLFGG